MTNDDAQSRLIQMSLDEDVPGVWAYSQNEATAMYLGARAISICNSLGIELDSEYGNFLEKTLWEMK